MTVKGAAAGPEREADTTGIHVDVIGEGAVRRGAAAVTGLELGGRRARVVLTVLALTGGPVPAERLATLIWPDGPPPTWPAALRGTIRALRAALGAVGADGQRLIATTPSGYCLVPGARVDLDRAETAVTEATVRAGHGRHEAAIAAAEPVTTLSGEQLLADEDGPWLVPHRARVDALALRSLELVAESAGALGDHHRAVAAARRAVSAGPLNERAHRVLFRALHRAGDRAGVVQAYEACRETLAEQLGVDPAQETIEAYLAAIGSAAPPAAARTAGSGTAPGPVAPRPPARVPQPSSAFFGREPEIAALAAALREPGLVTVAGRGGVGKTRLVTQVARDPGIAAELSGGRLWVSLAAVDRDELVAAEAAMALGLAIGTDDAAELIAGHLAPLGRALLVLDGCEAVLDGTASLAVTLLAACPALTLVVTSRAPLAVEAECVTTVAAFPPVLAGGQTWRELAASDHVRLLADRARRSGGQLVVSEATAPFVAELCRRCGGLPLAIELAGAQLAAMSVPDLLDHLSEPAADGADRVRAIAESSYALLDPDEATVFQRLAVLDGPVALPFLREVVAGGAIAPVRLVRILRELTARGLLTVDRSGPRWRYHQDDDLHRLAGERLAAAGETGPVITRLADAVAALLPAEAKTPPGPYLDAISEVITAVRSVLSAAAGEALDPGRGLDVAFRLHRYWAATNVAEGRFWLSRLLAAAPPGTAAAHATYALGYLAYWAGDTAAATADLRSAAEQLRGQADEYAARALIYLGGLLDDMDQGEEALGCVRQAIAAAAPFGPDLQVGAAIGMGCVLAERSSAEAARFAAEAIALCRQAGSPEQLAATLPTAAMVCWQVGDLEASRALIAEAMPLLAGSRRIARVVLLSAAAGLALADGDLDGAVELGTAAEADGRALGIDRELPLIRCVLAQALLASGNVTEAAVQATAAITAARSLAFPFPLALGLETSALVLLRAAPPGDAGPAAASGRLLAAAQAIRARGSRPGPVPLAAAITAARQAAPPPPGPALAPALAADQAIALLTALAAGSAISTDHATR